jgi:hypothetical protein
LFPLMGRRFSKWGKLFGQYLLSFPEQL